MKSNRFARVVVIAAMTVVCGPAVLAGPAAAATTFSDEFNGAAGSAVD